MAKVCYLSVQWLEEARYTADNLLIAKIMHDLGKPLEENLRFYVRNSCNDSSMFIEALKKLFTVEIVMEEDEILHILLSNEDIKDWIYLTNKLLDTSMCEAVRMVNMGLEATFDNVFIHWDGKYSLSFQETGLLLNIQGSTYYTLYHEILESVLSFQEDLKRQVQTWKNYWREYHERNKRDQNHAS